MREGARRRYNIISLQREGWIRDQGYNKIDLQQIETQMFLTPAVIAVIFTIHMQKRFISFSFFSFSQFLFLRTQSQEARAENFSFCISRLHAVYYYICLIFLFFYKTLPKSSLQMHQISLRFYEMGYIKEVQEELQNLHSHLRANAGARNGDCFCRKPVELFHFQFFRTNISSRCERCRHWFIIMGNRSLFNMLSSSFSCLCG